MVKLTRRSKGVIFATVLICVAIIGLTYYGRSRLATTTTYTLTRNLTSTTTIRISTTSTHILFVHLETAVWLNGAYLYDNETQPTFRHLVTDIKEHEINYLFIFFESFESSGRFQFDKAPAIALIQLLHKYEPGVSVIPVLSGRGSNAYFEDQADRAAYELDLSNDGVRYNIANMTAELVSLGFDGIQLDIEGVRCNDVHCQDSEYTEMVGQVRVAIENIPGIEKPHLSVALPARIGDTKCDSDWSRWANYANIAEYADSLIPLAYDYVPASGKPACGLPYQDWVRDVTSYTIENTLGKRALVFMGIRTGLPREPIGDAIHGIRDAVAFLYPESLARFRGVAVFIYGHNTLPIAESDWKAIET